ncbi:TonB-dependent siderophore myxochelin receptor MxcH [Pyxidicoccus fallax]|uniref:TonB-dependent receptor n=1 Tax=Pyxidicoccus fallax TaxID=394095 RepID=A0A848LIL7_9BACT|nr:TonB-dependent receptor [Pyxidicoccus fallax]NPC82915.1 TonB-dependent siderophore myxochelin receptor MxcH [Pyxidicoccus fallax]
MEVKTRRSVSPTSSFTGGLLLLLAGVASAQPAPAPTEPAPAAVAGTIDGRVTPCPGGVLAQTELLLDANGQMRPLKLDSSGRFRVEGLAPGTYEVHTYVPGCEPAGYRVQVAAGQSTTLHAELVSTEGMETTIDVEGRKLTRAEERKASAEAVRVVELEQAHQQTADLGEVLSRNAGVSVQRTGGLGSSSRLSLNGFSGEQVRFFVDGVPLELAGFGVELANVPVNLLKRVEVYRGVVPVRFGADALGGAVNLVSSDGDEPSGASASLQAGSFGTWRGSLAGRHQFGEGGFFLKGHAFGDLARNDYRVDVEVPNAQGRLEPASVSRFHDGYRALGGGLEVGVANRPFAERLSLRAYGTRARKELQHNVVMTVPYGEARSTEAAYGALLSWTSAELLSGKLRLEGTAGHGVRDTGFRDTSAFVYDWHGNRVRERLQPGELSTAPTDRLIRQHSTFARLHAAHALTDSQSLRLSLAPTFVTRQGEERLLRGTGQRDPLRAQRELLTGVAGLEHELRTWEGRLENVTFVKGYLLRSRSEEVLAGDVTRRRDQTSGHVGAGLNARLLLPHGLLAKASYEYATRLPGPDEFFGDGVLILDNLGLEPETSHNANVELELRDLSTPAGTFRGSVGGFARLADQLIVLLGNDSVYTFANVYAARSLGVEAAAGWTVPGGWLSLDANTTWQDFRNASSEGTYGAYSGDRIPNRPWLFANVTASLRRGSLLRAGDEASLSVTSRYVHGFFRGWESQGLREDKQKVPSQLTHSLAVTYALPVRPAFSGTLEAQNLTDAKTYDFFGAQRPGRSFFFKLTMEL